VAIAARSVVRTPLLWTVQLSRVSVEFALRGLGRRNLQHGAGAILRVMNWGLTLVGFNRNLVRS